MFAYVDETGNTGANVFDKAQPVFVTAALVTRSNFDLLHSRAVKELAASVGQPSLHGKSLGIYRIEELAPGLLRSLRAADAHLAISRVEKLYLVATKIFDTLFDSGENAAVPWSAYNIRPLRLMLAFKVASTITFAIAEKFWASLLDRNESNARTGMIIVADEILSRVSEIHDQRSRTIVSDALKWVIDHPEVVHFSNDRKIARNGHLPNVVAFSNLLDGMDSLAKKLGKKINLITHDRQSEFEASLKHLHELFSNASPEPLIWAGETSTLQKVPGSQFETKTDDESAGIQAVDIIIWLYLQVQKGNTIGPKSSKLLNFVLRRGLIHDFSFRGVGRQVDTKLKEIMNEPVSDETLQKARELQRLDEERRIESMREYEKDGVLPYMRGILKDVTPTEGEN